MTREKLESTRWPTPLMERKGRLGRLVRAYVQETEVGAQDEAAYQRLSARATGPDPKRRQLLPILAAGLAATCAAIVVVVGLGDRIFEPTPLALQSVVKQSAPVAATPSDRARSRVTTAAAPRPLEMASPATAKAPAPVVGRLHLREQRTSLPVGRVELTGEAIATLSTDGVATGRTTAKNTEIVLGEGDLALNVLPRPPGHVFTVRAGPFRFTVVGTAFTVSLSRSRLKLTVREGKVAVWRGEKRLTMVAAGQRWDAELRGSPRSVASAPAIPSPAIAAPSTPPPMAFAAQAPTAAARPAPPPVSTPPEVPLPALNGPPTALPSLPVPRLPDCRRMATSQHTSEALRCYQVQSAKGGLAGETAQYELARLWRDSLGDLARALAAFEDQRSRFPNGALRIEADLSIIELLPRLGRHAEAMAETEKLLATHPKAERRGELRLLRGNILREVLHDLARAEREYAQGAESGGRAGDDCRFLRAVCLEALGRTPEARKTYEAYLLGNEPSHAQEARKRLERLRP